MNLSAYIPNNIEEIKELFTRVFSDSEGKSEGELIGKLVGDLMTTTTTGDLYGFVAIEKNKIIGSIFFSKVIFESDVNAFILSPVAVETSYQKRGIGQKLINFGIKSLKKSGIELLITYGDPNYYSKVGFTVITEELIKAPLKLSYPEGWLGQSLASDMIEPIPGNSKCVEALNNPVYW